MKTNVLVFPCGSEVGLEINKSLNLSTHFELFGASSVEDHGKLVFQNYINDLPFVDDEQFITRINQVIDRHKIKYIIPAHDDAVTILSQAVADGKLNCSVLTSPAKTCEIARSKLKTYQELSGDVLVPKVYKSAEAIPKTDFPVFLKPDASQGSKGTYLAESISDVHSQTSKNPELIILEYLPGKEYTVDCFTDKNGILRFCEGRQRARISNGISVKSFIISDPRFMQVAQTINKKLKFRGVWFFQLKEDRHGELVLMEFAPRVAGTMGLSRCRGVNLVLLSLFDAMDFDIDITENKYELTIDRALENSYQSNLKYKNVYIDFDDLVIFHGKVNTQILAFIYQCFNNQIKVHLLTRHKADLTKSLKKHRLSSLFDSITWVKDNTDKSDYIKEPDSIFIDDSFAERKKVQLNCNIPVFDGHMLEALMEGK